MMSNKNEINSGSGQYFNLSNYTFKILFIDKQNVSVFNYNIGNKFSNLNPVVRRVTSEYLEEIFSSRILLAREGRTYTCFVSIFWVMPDNESNSLTTKCVRQLWKILLKQLRSAPSHSLQGAVYTLYGYGGLSVKTMPHKGVLKFNIIFAQEPFYQMSKQNPNEVAHHKISAMSKVQMIRKYIPTSFVFKDLSEGKEGTFIFDSTRTILFLVPNIKLNNWLTKKYINYSSRVISKRIFKCFILKPKMVSQGLLDPLFSLISTVRTNAHFMYTVANNYKNPQIASWVMDVMALTLELYDPYFWRPVSLLKFLTRMYSSILRFSDFKTNHDTMFLTQSLDNPTDVDSAMLLLTCFGLPEKIMTTLKQISLLTNKKILDSPNIFLDLIGKGIEACYDLLQWLKNSLNLPIMDTFIEMLTYPLTFIRGLKLSKEMTRLTTQFQRDNQSLFDPAFRLRIGELYAEVKINNYIQNLITNPSYKIYLQQYNLLETINKLCSNFDSSSRCEPVCFVFEGKAGLRKSVLMNKLVEYLTKQNYSVYTHSCPSVDAGKDFYDDYLNQDVFVMDDVGQQGVSQWRQIINFVSPVKFPLECASANLKNTKFFDSKLLLLSTNHFSDLQGFTKSDCITEPAALFRRCHVINFDNVDIVNGVMQGHLQYKKYNYLNSTWVTHFIAPMQDCHLPTRMDVTNINRAVAWLYSITTTCLNVQRELFNVNQLSIEDQNSIDNFVEELNEQEEFDDAVENPMEAQVNLNFLSFITEENVNVFKEYFTHFKEFCIDSSHKLINFVKSKITVQNISSLTSKVLEGLAVTFITMSATRIYDSYMGKINLDRFDSNTYRQQSVEVWQQAHSQYLEKTRSTATNNVSNSDTLSAILASESELGTRISGIKNKMRVVEMISEDGYKNVSQCIISGRRLLIQSHAYTSDKGIANVFQNWNCYSNSSYECNNIPFRVVKEWKEYDLAVIEIQLTVPIYKDATVNLFSKDLMLDVPSNIRKLFFVNSEAAISLDNNFVINHDAFQVQTPNRKKIYTVQPGAGIRYPVTAAGLCGSLIVDSEFGFCGIHVAGNSENGFAFVLPRRTLKEIKTLLTNVGNNQFNIKENDDVNYSGLKIFNDVYPSKTPLKDTKLAKSEMHDDLNEMVMEVGEKLPPNFLAFGSKTLSEISKKSLKPIPDIPHEAIEFGKKCISQFLTEYDELSDFEVIKGIKEADLTSLNKDSVNGYGYKNDKDLYIDFETGTITAEFQKKLNDFINQCETDSVSVDNLLFYEAFKDELRVEEKINKPRTFRVAPLHHTFLVKKFCGKLFSHCRSNMWDNQMAIGINPYKDWDKLYKRLKRCNINFDGDFGNWDGGAPAQVQDAISELVLQFYKGSNKNTFKTLLDSMVRSFVLIKEKLVLTTHSMPSGCWVTAFFNSLINRFLTALVLYTEKTKRNEKPLVEDFNKLTDFVFGDDKICGAPYELQDYFNAFTMKSLAESIGMKYTDGDKGEITSVSKALVDCVFLKRGFTWHKKLGKIVGPLSKTTLINSLRYTDSSREYDQIMDGKMTAFQFEVYLHEDEKFKKKVLDYARQKYFYFKEFTDEHISRTMLEKDTYLQIMLAAGKNIANYS